MYCVHSSGGYTVLEIDCEGQIIKYKQAMISQRLQLSICSQKKCAKRMPHRYILVVVIEKILQPYPSQERSHACLQQYFITCELMAFLPVQCLSQHIFHVMTGGLYHHQVLPWLSLKM